MNNLLQRYEAIRPKIKNGAILLVRGSKALAKTIQWADDAYFNHSALIFDANGRHMVLDSNALGVRPDFLSQRISEYVDFVILNPIGYDQKQLDRAVDLAICKDLQLDIKYDFALLPKVLVARKLGRKINHDLDSNRSICSVFTGYHYAKLLGEYSWVNEALKKNYFTPQDHMRFINNKWEVLK
jgi:hypothetical protein